MTVWGEPSAYHVPAELSYLAFARFTYDPLLEWDEFLRADVAPRLGGDAAATRYLEIVALLDSEIPLEQARLRSLRRETLEGARQVDDDASRRWLWLADRIGRREVNSGGLRV